MPSFKTIATHILAVGMTAGLATGTTAHADPGDLVSSFRWDWSGRPAEEARGDSERTQTGLATRGLERVGIPVEGGDPRASGLMTEVENSSLVQQLEDDDLFVTTVAQRIVNDGGSWSGTGTRTLWIETAGEEHAARGVGTSVLTGHGGYEGLTLILTATTPGEPVWGWIVPTDAVPPVPEVPGE